MTDQLTIDEVAELSDTVLARISEIVVDMAETIEIAVATVIARGHVLLEDVPGLGKTLAARTIARVLGLQFSRIQCTPDLLPSDITGSFVYAPSHGTFEFRHGPIFAGLVLADEINRTTPKTQSSFLEGMAEGRVTVDGTSFDLPDPFHVIATSNPIEFEGTYALPEAQLDRFMVRLSVGYLSPEAETRMLLSRAHRRHDSLEIEPALNADQLLRMQSAVESVHVDPDVARYCVDLANATRQNQQVQVGASPRGSQSLMLLARAIAVMGGRDYVTPDDIKRIAVPVLAHRLTLTAQAWANGVRPESIVITALGTVSVPPTVSSGVA